jgi:hypothetical protein
VGHIKKRMSSIYNYTAFGLNFQSEFEIPEFIISDNKPEVFLKRGEVPKDLIEKNSQGVRYQSNKNEFLLNVDNVARFYVKNGNEIIVGTEKEQVDKEIRLFLLGSALGALFIQRGLLPIHGSAVKFGNRATIFTGQSGVGKSSIASFFLQKGFQVLTDDICVINENLELNPGFPKMKLWHDVVENLNLKKENLSKVRDDMQKYHLPIENQFYSKSIKPERLIIIQTQNSKSFEIEELFGIKKFNAIKNNTYRYRFVGGLEKRLEHFKILNKLLPEIKVYRVSRPQYPIMLKEFADFLTKELSLDV